MTHLSAVTYLAPNWRWLYQAVVDYLGRSLQLQTSLTDGLTNPLEDPLLLQDKIDLTFICGLPFSRHQRNYPDQFRPIVAPVMSDSRYNNQPVYFADVIVRADSPLTHIQDLWGKTFCYNDPDSNSGYHLLRHFLFQQGYPVSFFQRGIQSGSHQRSLRWVIERKADCAAIDSVVLGQEFWDDPALSDQLRVIESIGPYPMPPVIVAQHLGETLIEAIKHALLNPDPTLQSALHRAGILRFAEVQSTDYQILLETYDAALNAGFDFVFTNASR
jgi:phosphonate transport system substrate-binding protein